MNRVAIWTALGIPILVGCKGQDKPADLPVTSPVVEASKSSAPSPSSPSSEKISPKSNEPQSPKRSLGSVSDSLKNDAYHYYGLGHSGEKKYRIEYSGTSQPPSTQLVTFQATKIDPDKLEFDENDRGTPSSTQSMSLDSKGLYVDSVKPLTLKTPHFLELPASLAPGATWESNQGGSPRGDQTLTQFLKFQVVGEKKITTPAGAFSALYIVGSGTGTLSAMPGKIKVDSWYVKDLGLVKQEFSFNGQKTKLVIKQTLQK